MPDKSEDKKSTWIDIVIGLIDITKAALWPALVSGIYISIHQPVNALIERMPDVIGRADVITLGDLNIKLNKELAVEASQEVRKALSGLSGDAALMLLKTDKDTPGACGYDHDPISGPLEELKERNLISASKIENPDFEEIKVQCYDVDITDLGIQTKSFILNTLATILTPKAGDR